MLLYTTHKHDIKLCLAGLKYKISLTSNLGLALTKLDEFRVVVNEPTGTHTRRHKMVSFKFSIIILLNEHSLPIIHATISIALPTTLQT